MKKQIIFCLVLVVIICSSYACYGMSAEKQEKRLNNQLTLSQEAYSNRDYKKAIQVLINMYYTKKKDWLKKEQVSEKEVNGLICSRIAIISMEAYENTKDLRYYKIAKRYAIKAIKLETKITESVEVAMRCGCGLLDKKLLLNSYEYLCSIDKEKCEQYQSEVFETAENIDFAVQRRKEQKKENIRNATAGTFLFMGVLLRGAGQILDSLGY